MAAASSSPSPKANTTQTGVQVCPSEKIMRAGKLEEECERTRFTRLCIFPPDSTGLAEHRCLRALAASFSLALCFHSRPLERLMTMLVAVARAQEPASGQHLQWPLVSKIDQGFTPTFVPRATPQPTELLPRRQIKFTMPLPPSRVG